MVDDVEDQGPGGPRRFGDIGLFIFSGLIFGPVFWYLQRNGLEWKQTACTGNLYDTSFSFLCVMI